MLNPHGMGREKKDSNINGISIFRFIKSMFKAITRRPLWINVLVAVVIIALLVLLFLQSL